MFTFYGECQISITFFKYFVYTTICTQVNENKRR